MKKKVVALILSAMLVLGIAMGATLAWLTDTATVTNTFTPSDVDIDLTETTPTGNTAKMVPGSEIAKNPQVTVSANSEKCFVFVKIDGDALTKTVVDTTTSQSVPLVGWSVADGWTALTGVAGVSNVYWRIVDPSVDTVLTFPVLADNQVTISEYATKSDMNAIASAGIQMNFTAYAVQYENVAVSTNPDADAAAAENAALAWAKRVEPTTP